MTSFSYKYGIILPVRNGGNYIKECVQSILSQTVSSFNLHVLDNNSADGTLEWLNSLNDHRILLYPSGSDLSIEENWGRIKTIKKNEFITIIGHDDVLHNHYLSTIGDLIANHPQASLYQTYFRLINAKGEMVRRCRPMDQSQTAPAFLKSLLTDTLDTMGTGYMMRSADYDSLGGIQPYPNLLFADHELWLKLSAINYKVTSKEECFSYRVHESTSKKSHAVKYTQAFYKFMDFLNHFAANNSEAKEVLRQHVSSYLLYYCRSLSHRLLSTPASEREGMTVKSIIDRCTKYAAELAPGHEFMPDKQFNIRLARNIDSNILTRNLYLLFRKVYRKPIYS